MAKIKKMGNIMLVRIWSNSDIAGVNIKWYNYLGKGLEIRYKTNRTAALLEAVVPLVGDLPKRNEHTCLQKDLKKNLHSSFIYNRPKL